ncbi:DUF397 domain-containing protein [Actinomadura vinacea]|uniref:DUF397 domain-containing protein n=1 Tax=Actinomadura vinacea TaxID=115336 RepID=A0ABN3KII4_9ACTN
MTSQNPLLITWRKSSYSGGEGGSCVEVAAGWRKSSRSGGQGGQCIEVAPGWRKSSHSAEQGGQCVEVAVGERVILARDSKMPDGAVLSFEAAEWTAFVREVKQGGLDLV